MIARARGGVHRPGSLADLLAFVRGAGSGGAATRGAWPAWPEALGRRTIGFSEDQRSLGRTVSGGGHAAPASGVRLRGCPSGSTRFSPGVFARDAAGTGTLRSVLRRFPIVGART